jgi:hypothetical protein
MKKLFLLFGFFALVSTTQAQTQRNPVQNNTNATLSQQGRTAVDRQMTIIQGKVRNLNATQLQTIRTQLETASLEVEAAARATGDSATRIRRGQAAFRTADTGINNVLTPEQQTQYRAAEAELTGIRNGQMGNVQQNTPPSSGN